MTDVLKKIDKNIWLPIIVTIVANFLAIIYMTAVFKTTVELHIADDSAHFKSGEKTEIYVKLKGLESEK